MKTLIILVVCIAAAHASGSSSAASASSSVSSSSSASSSSVVSSTVSSSLPYVPSISVSSSLVSTVSSTLLSTVSAELANVIASNPSATKYLAYDEFLLATDPSAECAEKTIEQDIRSHAHTVTEIENALSSPSTVTNPTYVADLEQRYPSIVTAYQTMFDVETSHPAFAYVQTLLSSLELTHPTILTDISIEDEAASPSTVADESVVSALASTSPSVISDLHTVAELAENYPSLQAAESVIAYYEDVMPDVVATVSEAVNSPTLVDSPLPAEYPTLAAADLTIVNYEKVVPSSVIALLSEAISAPALVPAVDDSYVKELETRYTALAAAELAVESYKVVSPAIVAQVYEVEHSPSLLHASAEVENPTLAHALEVISSAKQTLPASVIASISVLEVSPAKVKAASLSADKAAAARYASIAEAYKVVEKYKKVNSAVVHKCSEELSASRVSHAAHSVQQHSVLVSAFKKVASLAQKFPVLAVAQKNVDCAESSHASAFAAYEHVSQARASMHQYVHHSAVVQKSFHQSFHHSVHHGGR